MESTLNSAGVDVNDVLFISNSSAIYVPNQSTTLKVEKVWLDEDGKEIDSPGVDEIEVKLWQQKTETNAVTVTVKSQGNQQQGWIGALVEKKIEIAKGSNLTIQISGVYDNQGLIMYGTGITEHTIIPNNQICTETINNVRNDMEIYIRPANLEQGNTFGDISFIDYDTPFDVPIGEKTLYNTVYLSSSNNWSHTWTDLPTTDNDGAPVYYTVEETTIPGYSVIYSSNNNTGVQTGLITITNQANGYVMPETGGVGTNLFTAGGLALLAAVGLMYIKQHRRRDESL